MTFIELRDSLPNGFHDAYLESMRLQLWTAGPDAVTEAEREEYRAAEVTFTGLIGFVVEPPGGPPHRERGLWLDAGDASEPNAPPSPLPTLPPGAFACWFFVGEWNSFLHLAAADVTFAWK